MYIHDRRQRSGKTYEERRVDKMHGLVKDSVRKNIDNFNFQIQFIESTWVIKEYYGGFSGTLKKRELVEIAGETPFGVLSVDKDKKKQCAKIHVWSDGMADGDNCFLINVPNGLFKEIHDG